MTRRQVWRYKCDHCGKANCSKYHIAKHEAACTLNPNRVCRMCQIAEEAQQPIGVLVAVAAKFGAIDMADVDANDQHDIVLKELRNAANGCPACMLAAIRQAKVYTDFDFKAACKAWWEDWNTSMEHY